jgi:hypothetical protein
MDEVVEGVPAGGRLGGQRRRPEHLQRGATVRPVEGRRRAATGR